MKLNLLTVLTVKRDHYIVIQLFCFDALDLIIIRLSKNVILFEVLHNEK